MSGIISVKKHLKNTFYFQWRLLCTEMINRISTQYDRGTVAIKEEQTFTQISLSTPYSTPAYTKSHYLCKLSYFLRLCAIKCFTLILQSIILKTPLRSFVSLTFFGKSYQVLIDAGRSTIANNMWRMHRNGACVSVVVPWLVNGIHIKHEKTTTTSKSTCNTVGVMSQDHTKCLLCISRALSSSLSLPPSLPLIDQWQSLGDVCFIKCLTIFLFLLAKQGDLKGTFLQP